MSFVYPGFLFALLALGIPIIVHLFNFKRFRKVYFSDVRFLKDIELQTRQRNQLKHLLVLITRLLAIAFLVMAFAQPVIPVGNETIDPSQGRVSIYLDNSFSMDAEGENGDLFEHGKQIAQQVAKAYSNSGSVRFYTNSMNAAEGRAISEGELQEEVSRAELSPYVRPLSQVVKRISDRSDNELASDHIYIVSDLQKISTDVQNIVSDSIDRVSILPMEASGISNLYIDSLWFESPIRQTELPDRVNIRIQNSGDTRKDDIPVKLILNGVQRAIANVTVEAKSYQIVPLSFTNGKTGFNLGQVSLTDHPITYDDNYFFSFELARVIHVLELKGKEAGTAVSGIFAKDEDFEFAQMNEDRVDYSVFTNYDLIVLNELEELNSGLIQELTSAKDQGTDVLLIPSVNGVIESYDELLLSGSGIRFGNIDTTELKVKELNLRSELYRNVFLEWKDRIDLPTVNSHFKLIIPSRSNVENLMRLDGGDGLLVRAPGNNGDLYVLTTSLVNEHSQLPHHAIIVPTFYNMALLSKTRSEPYQVLGRNDGIRLITHIGGHEVLNMRSVDGEVSIIPEIQHTSTGVNLKTYGQVDNAGHYMIMNGKDTLQTVSFNYDRTESDVSFYTVQQLESQIADLGLINVSVLESNSANISTSIEELHQGKSLWKLFLIIALTCIFIEILLLRFLS